MKQGPSARRKSQIALRAALMIAPVLILLAECAYLGHLSWNQYRARKCQRARGYWAAYRAECIAPRDHCEHAGKTLTVGETHYDGCNWCTCTRYFLRCTSKYCLP